MAGQPTFSVDPNDRVLDRGVFELEPGQGVELVDAGVEDSREMADSLSGFGVWEDVQAVEGLGAEGGDCFVHWGCLSFVVSIGFTDLHRFGLNCGAGVTSRAREKLGIEPLRFRSPSPLVSRFAWYSPGFSKCVSMDQCENGVLWSLWGCHSAVCRSLSFCSRSICDFFQVFSLALRL